MPMGKYKSMKGGGGRGGRGKSRPNGSNDGLKRSTNKMGLFSEGGKIMGAGGQRGYRKGLTHTKGGNSRTYRESDTYTF